MDAVHELTTNAPDAPRDDLEPLRAVVGDAVVVGIARAAHGSAELTRLTDRMIRLLVDDLGFGTLAIEASGPIVERVDGWLRDGRGELGPLLADAHPWWRSAEFVDVLRWMRERNRYRSTDDRLRLVGLEIPRRDMDEQERHIAETIVDRLRRTGRKTVLWSGSHSAVGHRRAVAWRPEDEGLPGSRNAGSHLRERLGGGYRSLGLTFHQGSVRWDGRVLRVPPASPGFTEALLDRRAPEPLLYDLTGGVSELAREPLRMRLIGPHYDPDRPASMTGGPLGEFFDAVLHTHAVTPNAVDSRAVRPHPAGRGG